MRASWTLPSAQCQKDEISCHQASAPRDAFKGSVSIAMEVVSFSVPVCRQFRCAVSWLTFRPFSGLTWISFGEGRTGLHDSNV